MVTRPRRLRQNHWIRGLARETRLSSDSLIYPIFMEEGSGIKTEIPSMPGQFRYSPDRVHEGISEAKEKGVSRFLLFGIPKEKDPLGSGGYAENGIVQTGLRKIREEFGESVFLITDVCMCEYTSHGHCGILDHHCVDNDKTLPYLSKIALSHVTAGADAIAPSDMMDGRVRALRSALDQHHFEEIPIISYAVKYSSSLYGPFREAAGSSPAFGDRKSYQMDFHNAKEALKEAFIDLEEGADLLIVKPSLIYGDIIQTISQKAVCPVAAYSVSGEYAMIKAASAAGWVDEYGLVCESAVAAFRSGAQILISYYAKEISRAIQKGDIG